MTDSGPLWLRIVIASIPLLAALIAGIFALTNTVNRRIERLKNLVEIRKEFPDWLDPDYALERVMLRQLQAIDQATTPILKWGRRILAVMWFCGILAYTTVALQWIHLVPQWHEPRPVRYAVYLAVAILFGVGGYVQFDRQQFRKRYQLVYNAIDERAQRPEEPSSDSEPQGEAESPQPTDSHD
jgi:hypothetical protein